MRISLLITLCFLASLTQLFGQIDANSITYKLPLVNNAEVQAIRTDVETTFDDLKEGTIWKPYDSTYTAYAKTAIWLKFEIENKSKDTVQNYIYSKEHYVTTIQQRGNGFKISENGYLFPLSQRTNKSEYVFTKISLPSFQKSLIYIRLNSNNTMLGLQYPTLYSQKGYLEFSNDIHKDQSKPIGFIYFYIIALITVFLFA